MNRIIAERKTNLVRAVLGSSEPMQPEGDFPLWVYSGIQAKCTEPVPVTTFGQKTASTMWIIPDTHRIVPVELLVAAQSVMDTEGFDKEAEELQAIIGKTGQ